MAGLFLARVTADEVPHYQFLELDSGIDAEIRSDEPDTSLGSATSITVDLSDGGAQTMGLLKFDLSRLTEVYSATLHLFVVSGTSGTIAAYRMKKTWNEDSTWNTFGGDGVQADGDEAREYPSFTIIRPFSGEYLYIDVTSDVQEWLEGGETNLGWVFLTDSGDGFDFNAFDASLGGPVLDVVTERGTNTVPTLAPTPAGPPTYYLTFAYDTEIRSDEPDAVLGDHSSITVDQSDGGGVTQALIKFNLIGIRACVKATLRLLTVSSTEGTITGYRMIKYWDESSTWNNFGGDGIQNDGHEAAVADSFHIYAPQAGTITELDVTTDVQYWLESGGITNQGWGFVSDSTDGWDFTTSESALLRPELDIVLPDAPATPYPTWAPPAPIGSDLDGLWVLNTAEDAEIRSDSAYEPYPPQTDIRVDLYDGAAAMTQVLLRFDFTILKDSVSLPAAQRVLLRIFTLDSTGGQVSAHRMLQPWEPDTVTWTTFGMGGVPPDDIVAKKAPSFTLTAPPDATLVEIDVTDDVLYWLEDDGDNYGWAFIIDSGDGWGFLSSHSQVVPPMLEIFYREASYQPPYVAPIPADLTGMLAVTKADDVELRTDSPYSPVDGGTHVTVDLSDSGSSTQALLKFDLSGVSADMADRVLLKLFSVNPSSATVKAYKMLVDWKPYEATWTAFGNEDGGGVHPDGIYCAVSASFLITAPKWADLITIDVTDDARSWVDGSAVNGGWVFTIDSGDGWDFVSSESPVAQPVLEFYYKGGHHGGSSSDDDEGALNGGIIALIVIVCLVVVAAVAYLFYAKRDTVVSYYQTLKVRGSKFGGSGAQPLSNSYDFMESEPTVGYTATNNMM